jgi:endo-1,4-beta-xylanase
MRLYGQSLVWFSELPDWFKVAPNADIEGIMNKRIDTLIGRYKDQIKFWNVVNEAVNDGGGPEWGDDGPAGTLRMKNKWVEAMGTDYIRKAFVQAHAVDPTAVLYYNDFNLEHVENQAKFEGVKNLLIDLKKQGTPVHALGWQMHLRPDTFTFDAAILLERMNEIADLGFDNYITELDVELPENARAADYEQQKQIYKAVVETFLKARRHKTIVTWGIHDGDPGWLTNNHPFLFDENFNKKPAYFGVQEALQ